MIWLFIVVIALAAMAGGGFLFWRRRVSPNGPDAQAAGGTRSASAPDAGAKGTAAKGAFDLGFVERLTDKIPSVLKTTPDPVVKDPHRAGAGLQGNLAQTPLHDLLQYLALGHKSGILELVSGRRTGRIVLKDGRVYRNSYRGKDGMEAMFMMMDLPEGDFEFYEQTLDDAISFSGLEVVDIIMLWMDRKPKKKA